VLQKSKSYGGHEEAFTKYSQGFSGFVNACLRFVLIAPLNLWCHQKESKGRNETLDGG